MKVEMREDKHLSITFNPQQGDPREIIIDAGRDVRICDGHHVVKTRFDKLRIKDVLVDDVFVYPDNVEMRAWGAVRERLYNDVERILSHSLQPGIGHRELLKEVTAARDNLRKIMQEMGWKGQF